VKLSKSYDDSGRKIMSEGVSSDEVSSLRLEELEGPSVQDELIETLRECKAFISACQGVFGQDVIMGKARAALKRAGGER
jgi:hypothetical protein